MLRLRCICASMVLLFLFGPTPQPVALGFEDQAQPEKAESAPPATPETDETRTTKQAPPEPEPKFIPPAVKVGTFQAQLGRRFDTEDGLATNDILAIEFGPDGRLYAGTDKGLYTLNGSTWSSEYDFAAAVPVIARSGDRLFAVLGRGVYQIDPDGATLLATFPADAAKSLEINSLAAGKHIWIATSQGLMVVDGESIGPMDEFNNALGDDLNVRSVAVDAEGRVAVAAAGGLFQGTEDETAWQRLFPYQENESWAVLDARGVALTEDGTLWFCCPQGVGRTTAEGWTLYTGKTGLPYNDFTGLSTDPSGVVWFTTTRGAIRFDGENWEYRNGLRWVPAGLVRDVAIAPDGDAWLATSAGIGQIDRFTMTLAEKAEYMEQEIDTYHRRTPFGFVLGVKLKNPGDKSEYTIRDSDNDGLWTAMYGAGECYAYAATKDPKAKQRATNAFKALAFLSEVTQGGENPAPHGYPARTILPTSGENPNDVRYTPEKDQKRRDEEDPLWKVMELRWPTSADGQWYWKSDTSSDELDGHYFLYALYYDLVAETPEEKEAVVEVVRRITDHLLAHNFNLMDHDGLPTRWAYFNPERLNDPEFWAPRGLNSLSILSYLKTAEHIVGDPRYAEAYRYLIEDHAYDANLMYPKAQNGPGTGNQSDDEMAFMCYYTLLKYETDPELLTHYSMSLLRYWTLEAPERSPLFNFIFAASCRLDLINEKYGRWGIRVPESCFTQAVDTLERIPLDRIRWGHENSHRTDVVPLYAPTWGRPRTKGHLQNGLVIPVDERHIAHWNQDPWRLDEGGNGTDMADGAVFLLPYYMGLYHGFIEETVTPASE